MGECPAVKKLCGHPKTRRTLPLADGFEGIKNPGRRAGGLKGKRLFAGCGGAAG